MMRCIKVGLSTIQGMFLCEHEDGTITILVGTRRYRGEPVSAE